MYIFDQLIAFYLFSDPILFISRPACAALCVWWIDDRAAICPLPSPCPTIASIHAAIVFFYYCSVRRLPTKIVYLREFIVFPQNGLNTLKLNAASRFQVKFPLQRKMNAIHGTQKWMRCDCGKYFMQLKFCCLFFTSMLGQERQQRYLLIQFCFCFPSVRRAMARAIWCCFLHQHLLLTDDLLLMLFINGFYFTFFRNFQNINITNGAIKGKKKIGTLLISGRYVDQKENIHIHLANGLMGTHNKYVRPWRWAVQTSCDRYKHNFGDI